MRGHIDLKRLLRKNFLNSLAKLTALAVNLKRIAAILSSKKGSNPNFTVIFLKYLSGNNKFHKMCT
jgi:hypothetical protein